MSPGTRTHLFLDRAKFDLSSDGTLVAESSDLRVGTPQGFYLREEGKVSVWFDFVGADRNGDDVAGWNYAAKDGRKLLIIND